MTLSPRSASSPCRDSSPKRPSVRPEVEMLEGRDTPSAGSVHLIADPTHAGHKVLTVEGTRRNDKIAFTRSGGELTVKINGTERGTYKVNKLSQVAAMGNDGNDKITMSSRVGINTLFRGGTGDDVLRGGRGINAFYGDEGDDVLYGGSQNDWLDGGSGNDAMYGYDGSDALWGDDGYNSYYGGTGTDYFYGSASDAGGGYDSYYDYGSSDVSYGAYTDPYAGYTYHIGEVNPYTGTSSYRYYDDSGSWFGWGYSSPDYSWYTTMPSWYQDLAYGGYSRIGTTNAYGSDYSLYNSYGDYSGWWYLYNWYDW